jgi:hypothetical protein
MEKMRKLIKQHKLIQQKIDELEDVILANERNLGRGKFKAKRDDERREIKRLENERRKL